MITVTFGRNLDGRASIRVNGKEVGSIEFGPRGPRDTFMLWLVKRGDQIIAASPYRADAVERARKHFAIDQRPNS